MKSNYLAENSKSYDAAYKQGYGLQYPDGHIIRIYHKVLKNAFENKNTENLSLFDFGCGTGAHSLYFQDLGFNVFGVDVSKEAINTCKAHFEKNENRFQVVDAKPWKEPPFQDKCFDLVLANQVLYFFSESDLQQTVENLFQITKPGGFFIATMMGTKNFYFDYGTLQEDGIYRVELPNGKLLNINFTDSPENLIEKFKPYTTEHVGYYDSQIVETEGSGFHYIFIGRKPEK